MRIVINGDALDLQYAGVHFYVKNLLEEISDVGCDHEIIVLTPIKQKPTADSIHFVHVPLYTWIPFFQMIRLFILMPIAAIRYKADVFIEPAHFGPFLLPERIKRVTVIHDMTPLLYPEWHTLRGWMLQKAFLPSIIRRADLIITNSAYTKSDIVRLTGKDPNRIAFSHLGVDPSFKPTNNKLIIQKIGITFSYILYLGTIEPRKNIENLIEAFEKFKSLNKDSELKLVIAGKMGWKTEQIKKKLESSAVKDDIVLPGYVNRSDMPSLYSHAKMVIYPSLYEGFGMPIIEAMACGVPVLCSKVSSMPEVGGFHAFYFDPNDPHSICETMVHVHEQKEYNSKKAIAYAQSFSWKEMATDIIRAIEKLL